MISDGKLKWPVVLCVLVDYIIGVLSLATQWKY